MMTSQARAARRVKIVRRCAARRVATAQREVWKRRSEGPEETVDEPTGTVDDLAELPDSLLG
jgi:hypothetical protein